MKVKQVAPKSRVGKTAHSPSSQSSLLEKSSAPLSASRALDTIFSEVALSTTWLCGKVAGTVHARLAPNSVDLVKLQAVLNSKLTHTPMD